jgi:hypothetical protein
MNLKKTVAIAATAGALAAISVPAMAFENEFHGTYTFNAILSNFQDGGSGDFSPITKNDRVKTNNYFEQRGRIQYIAKASDDLKLVTHFELDTRFGGITDGKYTSTTDSGTLDTDGVTLETKHVYLDFNLGDNFNVKTGLMPYKDTLKGIFVDADVPAVYTTTKLGAYTLGAGFSRFGELQQNGSVTGLNRLGDNTTDLYILDNTFAFNKSTKVALSYYFLDNNAVKDQTILLNTLGASGETQIGPLNLSGFAAIQDGHRKNTNAAGAKSIGNSLYFHGWAANAAAKLAVGPGTAKAAFLFTSGNNNTAPDAQNRGWAPSAVTTYNEGDMMILVRDTANSPTTTDRYLRRSVTNVALASMGYNANLTDKIFANGNVGFAWAPASAGAPVNKDGGKSNAGDLMGTEFNLEAGYKVYTNLTLRAQAAYAVLGGYYKGAAANSITSAVKDPENPYTMRLLASFKF